MTTEGIAPMGQWPETLSREQFINALYQFLVWLDPNDPICLPIDYEGVAQQWVDEMDEIAT